MPALTRPELCSLLFKLVGPRSNRRTVPLGLIAPRGMKIPPYVEFDEDLSLFLWRPRLILNEAVVDKVVAFIGEKEAHSEKPFNRFSDTLRVDAIDLNFRYVFQVALFRRLSYAGRSPVKSVILVRNIALAHYSKMHALLTRGSPLKVKIFEEREAAAKWLGVPVDSLKAK